LQALIGIEKSQLTHRRLCESKSHASDSHRSGEAAIFQGAHKIDVAFRYARRCFKFAPADNRFPDLVRWLAPYHRDHLFRYRKGNGELAPPYAFSEAAEIIHKTIGKIELYVKKQYGKRTTRRT
jgi:hypothetical protein